MNKQQVFRKLLKQGCSKDDIRKANLDGADLEDANLRGANLRGANLLCANLILLVGNGNELISMQLKYRIVYCRPTKTLAVGCQQYPLSAVKDLTDAEISRMDDDALEWWQTNKQLIYKFCEYKEN
jgi:uncharacterized protein YjbI with pentapeptide repeats